MTETCLDVRSYQLGESTSAHYMKGIRVNMLLRTLMGRTGRAEESAKVLCFVLSDDRSYVSGGT